MTDVCRDPITFGELRARPGVVEELTLRGRVGICAFHGGNLERMTDVVAREAAEAAGASYYGLLQPPGMRHHLPSARIDPAESAEFSAFLEHCDQVVAVHGYGRRKHFTALLCGGGNRDLADHVGRHLAGRLPAYRVLTDLEEIPRPLRGLHRDNPVNLPSGGGMQLELPPRVRGVSPLADHWPGRPDRFPHLDDLVGGLAEGVRTWATLTRS